MSCVVNVAIQITFDIWKFASSAKKQSCDLYINGSLFWTEFLWFISRNNACTLWLVPFLYIFVPRNFFKKLCNKKQNDTNDNLSDETFEDDQYNQDNDGRFKQQNGKKMSKKKDSFLGDLERTDDGSSDEGIDD